MHVYTAYAKLIFYNWYKIIFNHQIYWRPDGNSFLWLFLIYLIDSYIYLIWLFSKYLSLDKNKHLLPQHNICFSEMAIAKSFETAQVLIIVAAVVTFLSTIGCMTLAMYFVSSLIFEWHVSLCFHVWLKKVTSKTE